VTTAAEFIREGCCTSACLAAITEPGRCSCPCGGEFHGLLSGADLTALLDGRRLGLHRLTDAEIVGAA
jgi:hypothetical protein